MRCAHASRRRSTISTSSQPASGPLSPSSSHPTGALGDLATPVAFELARALRRAPRAIAQEMAGPLEAATGLRAEAAPSGYLNFFLDRRAFLLERLQPRRARGGRPVEESDRRAHGHQSEQGCACGASAERRPGRHARTRAAFPGRSGGSTELHRRYGRAGGRRRRRVPTARRQDTRRSARALRPAALRLLLLGSLRARDRVVRRRPSAPERTAPRRFMPSRKATPMRRVWRISSPTASCGVTC